MESLKSERLDEILRDMYAAVSFPEGSEPDFARIATIFHPQARFTRVTPEGVDYFSLAEFQAFLTEMLDRGVFTAFFERELHRRVILFGAVAHVLSAYEIKAHPASPTALARGINSIQMLWQNWGWQVLSLAWDEEAANQRFDFEQLFALGAS
jgi:hypothetical protein